MAEKILYFDCFSGIAGDMTLGALIDLGVDQVELNAALAKLPVDDWSLDVQVDRRRGLRGVDVKVWVGSEKEGPAVTDDSSDSGPDHAHGHSGAHPGGNGEHDPADHTHDGHRHYADIVAIIKAGELPSAVEERALQAFETLARAEAKVHGVDIADVHFHEVGAVDSIIDIVGVAWCIWALGVDRIESAPLPMGRGFMRCAHGRIPLPAPATLEIVKGLEIVDAGLERELVTPTGAAFIKAWAQDIGPLPDFRILGVGWGHGDAEFPDRPNALRLILGERPMATETCEMIETNLDDTTPEVAGFLMERLLEAGALDAWITPIHMKKNRPGFTVCALVDAGRRRVVEDVFLTESSAIGVRRYGVDRTRLIRESVTVETPWGPIAVKTALREGQVVNVAPEFSDCAEVARATGIPLKTVFQHAIAGYYADEEDDESL